MLDDNHFHAIANATLMHFYDQLEQAYDQEDLEDLDYDEGAGILTIVTPDNKTFVISKHSPSHQVWLASPISGGLHFDYNSQTKDWVLPNGQSLRHILADNLRKSAGVQVVL